MTDSGISDNEEVSESDRQLVTDPTERRECAMCGSETKRIDHARYFKFQGDFVILEAWRCPECELQGNILRRRSDGEIIRIGHLHTGTGFEYPEPEA